MERTPLIGIAVVGLLGAGVAVVLALSMGPAVRTHDDPVAISRVEPSASPAEPALDGGVDDAPTSAPPKVEVGIPDPVPERPRPPPAVPSGPLEQTFHRTQDFLHEPLFLGLPPDATEADTTAYLADKLVEVENIVEEFREIAREEDDPELQGEALHRGALFYDRVIEQLPAPPPPHIGPDETEEWMARQEQTMQALQDKAHALREDAAIAVQQE